MNQTFSHRGHGEPSRGARRRAEISRKRAGTPAVPRARGWWGNWTELKEIGNGPHIETRGRAWRPGREPATWGQVAPPRVPAAGALCHAGGGCLIGKWDKVAGFGGGWHGRRGCGGSF